MDPYTPDVISAENSYLVVEGFLNTGGEPTFIHLSRTARLVDSVLIKDESSATVSIESESGMVYALENRSGGEYVAQLTDLNQQDQYRLRVITRDGREYLSEFVSVKETPEIDSVSWTYENDGVKLFVNTHDPENNTWFYRWEFDETWEYRILFATNLSYVDKVIIENEEHTPKICWQTNGSTQLILGSSTQLNRDIISLKPLIHIPKGSVKIGWRYSILVKQYALSAEAYNYYNQVKKNSEQMGSLFDLQPSEVRGNIKAIGSPKDPVIGFFQAGSVQEKRIYIDNLELDSWGYRSECRLKFVPIPFIDDYLSYRGYAPVYLDVEMINGGERIKGIYAAPVKCTDCSIEANPQKPDFWE